MTETLRILIVKPSRAGRRSGNLVTVNRWVRMLRALGHRVSVGDEYVDQACDMLVVLHARHGAGSALRFGRKRPEASLIVALSGTDLYRDLERSERARQALDAADRIVLLQPHGQALLPRRLHRRCRVIYQSVVPPATRREKMSRWWQLVVVGHLRSVKDPLRAARASRLLSGTSRIRVVHLGAALSESMREAATRESHANPRYRWLGSRSTGEVARLLGRSQMMVLSSKMEGGANVIGEAVVAGTPVLSTRISGSIGLLGPDYPGFYEVGDTAGLADMMSRAETDLAFYRELQDACETCRPLFDPARERETWRALLGELTEG